MGSQKNSSDRPSSSAILARLRALADPAAVEGMARFGISSAGRLGISIPNLRQLAKETGKNHALALELWSSGIAEARILASMIDVPKEATEEQLEEWVAAFDSWDVCDQCCMNLFEKTPYAWEKARLWSEREEEFVKRAGFVLMARLGVSDKKAGDERFEEFLEIIRTRSTDDRNYVKKAVNWALRQIGKRNLRLNAAAIEVGRELASSESRAAKWIAADALRELTGEAVQGRLRGT